MRISYWTHKGVKKDGTFKNKKGGQVRTEEFIEYCPPVKRSNSDAYLETMGQPYLMFSEGLKGTTVKGVSIIFRDEKEVRQLVKHLPKERKSDWK